jgi:hypothetical protein
MSHSKLLTLRPLPPKWRIGWSTRFVPGTLQYDSELLWGVYMPTLAESVCFLRIVLAPNVIEPN